MDSGDNPWKTQKQRYVVDRIGNPMKRDTKNTTAGNEADVIRRRDAAVKRALATPPKPHKEMKAALRKRRQAATAPTPRPEKRG